MLWILPGLLVLFAVACLIRALWETHQLEITAAVLGSGKNELRVVFFSDLHIDRMYINHEKIFNAIASAKADVILFGGDMTNRGDPVTRRKTKEFFANIRKIAADQAIPFYAVNGNHDHYDIDQELADEAVAFLSNQSVTITGKNGFLWNLAGLEDLRIGCPDYYSAVPQNTPYPVLVLAHNPDTVFLLPRPERAQHLFLLSGHFHGGQVWMPFSLEYKVLRKEKMADMGYRKGSFFYRGVDGYISRGLGCVILPFRFFSCPEISVLTLRTD